MGGEKRKVGKKGGTRKNKSKKPKQAHRKRNIAKVKKTNPRTGRKTYYLGHRVKDTGKAGLSTISECERMAKAIYNDYKAGRLTKREASGRFAQLHNRTIPNTKALKGKVRKAKAAVKKYWDRLKRD
ncbi:MAG: hypothetical protein H0Z28_10285 [Archaeoglobus sp.]|nr:hypothetical protein [Archaeoglobus sp.]